jgi:hypothetical protein
MDESKMSPSELYLERARSAGLLNGKNEAGIREVAEMLEHPYTLEQMQAQIKRADDKRKEQEKKKS